MEIIKPRERKERTEYSLQFSDKDGTGYAFPCDKHGKVFSDISKEAERNYLHCLEIADRFDIVEIIQYTYHYSEPAIGKCRCGTEIYLDGDVQCPKCGQWHNMFGQELIDSQYWERDYYGD